MSYKVPDTRLSIKKERIIAIDDFEFGNIPLEQYPYEIALRENYPDVDDTYRFVWARSDTSLPRNEEWLQKLKTASTVLEHASEVCKKLALQHSRMTPRKLTLATKALREVDHRMTDIISDLMCSYPIANENHYLAAMSIPEISESIPKILFCDEDEFAFWILELPPKNKNARNNLIILEAEDMLLHSQIPRFKKWHMDCFHIYHPDRMGGVLDVDNYNFKPVIDAVAIAMYAKDSYDNFSMSQYNISDYNIKPGFYFHIYKRDEKVRFLQNFTDRIRLSQNP